jgi:hypothetical protein
MCTQIAHDEAAGNAFVHEARGIIAIDHQEIGIAGPDFLHQRGALQAATQIFLFEQQRLQSLLRGSQFMGVEGGQCGLDRRLCERVRRDHTPCQLNEFRGSQQRSDPRTGKCVRL